ncbi:hypothetical protein [Roseovarius aestuariivivens]|uniref:hypothetical protein n=1 Tax=Roseovarius aestuariivivens TaxID=1888910 RepID=UPI001081ABF6|nr:hypothetical protein [Roseovarius aestuariivivens]
MRVLLATPRSVTWMKSKLPELESDGYVKDAIKPREQAMVLMSGFVSGRDFDPPLPHDMQDHEAGIWELRTDDLRFFGWIPKPSMFCLSSVETARKCKDKDLYNGFKTQAMHDREEISLYGGSYETGEIRDLI